LGLRYRETLYNIRMIKVLIGADLVIAAAFAFAYRTLPEQIPIFYSKPWGESQIADTWYIFLLPIVLHTLYFLNKLFVQKFFPEDQVVKKIMTYANLFFIVSFTGVFLKIIFLVS